MDKHFTCNHADFRNHPTSPLKATAALTKRRARIRDLAGLYILLPPLFLLALRRHGIALCPRETLGQRLRAQLRARRSAGVLGPWWSRPHQDLHALCIATRSQFWGRFHSRRILPKKRQEQSPCMSSRRGLLHTVALSLGRLCAPLIPEPLTRIRDHRLGDGRP